MQKGGLFLFFARKLIFLMNLQSIGDDKDVFELSFRNFDICDRFFKILLRK